MVCHNSIAHRMWTFDTCWRMLSFAATLPARLAMSLAIWKTLARPAPETAPPVSVSCCCSVMEPCVLKPTVWCSGWRLQWTLSWSGHTRYNTQAAIMNKCNKYLYMDNMELTYSHLTKHQKTDAPQASGVQHTNINCIKQGVWIWASLYSTYCLWRSSCWQHHCLYSTYCVWRSSCWQHHSENVFFPSRTALQEQKGEVLVTWKKTACWPTLSMILNPIRPASPKSMTRTVLSLQQ